MRWLIDGNNLMGAHPDGWWRDRGAAQVRWAARIAAWAATHTEPVTLLFDGTPPMDAQLLALDNLHVEFASRPGPDAADDRIVALAEASATPATVVTADRGLIARLPAHAHTVGPRSFARALPTAGAGRG